MNTIPELQQGDIFALQKAQATATAAWQQMCKMYAELGEAKKRIGEVHQAVDLLLAAPLLRILSEPITSLSLSVRAYNVLAKGGLTTLGHVAACSYEDLRAYRNCGETTAKEIQTAMNQVGIPMGFNVELMRKRFPNII